MNIDIEACLNLMNDCAIAIMAESHKKDPLLVTHKVMAYMTAILANENRCPVVDEVAEKLAMSSPTLRRKLYQEGGSYQQIADDLRLDLAMKLLAKGVNIENVAYDLGFSAPSGFSRAFKQWAGKPPCHWRKQA